MHLYLGRLIWEVLIILVIALLVFGPMILRARKK